MSEKKAESTKKRPKVRISPRVERARTLVKSMEIAHQKYGDAFAKLAK